MKSLKSKILFGAILFMTATVSLPFSVAFSQTANTPPATYTLLEPLPDVSGSGAPTFKTEVTLNDYIIYAFDLFIALAAVAAVIMIVWGGFEYVVSAVPGTKNDGKNKITNAVVGLLMVLATFLILQTINPQLVAIPATLVEPIKNVQKESAFDFFQKIRMDADYGLIQDAKIRAEVQGILTKKEQLEKENQEILAQMANMNQSDFQYAELKLKLEQNKEEIRKNSTQAILKLAETGGINVVGKVINDLTSQGTSLNEFAIERIFTSALQQLSENRIQYARQLHDIGVYDTSAVHKKMDYYEYMIKIMKLDSYVKANISGIYATKKEKEGYLSDLAKFEKEAKLKVDETDFQDIQKRIEEVRGRVNAKYK